MLWGALRSLRARPTPAPALMCVGFAWASANAWRATAWRLQELDAGGSLSHGLAEVWAIGIGAVICLVTFGVLLVLVARNTSAP